MRTRAIGPVAILLFAATLTGKTATPASAQASATPTNSPTGTQTGTPTTTFTPVPTLDCALANATATTTATGSTPTPTTTPTGGPPTSTASPSSTSSVTSTATATRLPLTITLALTEATADSITLEWVVDGPLDGLDHWEVWRLQGATFTINLPAISALTLAAGLLCYFALRTRWRRRRNHAFGGLALAILAGLAWAQTGGSGYARIDDGSLTDPGLREYIDTMRLADTTYCYFVRAVRVDDTQVDSNVNCAVTGSGVTGPAIGQVVPSVGWNGEETAVTVLGSNLLEAPLFIALAQGGFNVTNMTGIELVSSTEIAAIVPAGLIPGIYDVNVVFSGQSFLLPGAFTVTDVPPPQLFSIFPESGWNGAPTTVTLTGKGFVVMPTVVLIGPDGRVAALENLTYIGDSSITGQVPSGLPAADYDVVVTNPNGLSSRLDAAFRVSELRPPDILDVNPTSLFANSGLGIAGNNPVATVRFVTPGALFFLVAEAGGDDIPVTLVTPIPATCDPCQLEFDTAPQSQGSYALKVVNPDQQSDVFGSIFFTPSSQGKLAGSWKTEDEPLVFARQKHAGVYATTAIGSRYLYTGGGETEDEPLRLVEVAPLDLFGHVGRWRVTRPLSGERTGLGMFTASSADGSVFVHAFGGSAEIDGDPGLTTGERARVLDESTVPQDVGATAGAGSLAAGNWVYRVSSVIPLDGEGLPSDASAVTLASAAGADVTWTAVNGAIGYRVYRSDEPNIGGGREHLIGILPDGVMTNFSDGGLTPLSLAFTGLVLATPAPTGGTFASGTYLYRLTAVTVHGETAATAEATAVVTGGGTGRVDLSWPAFTDTLLGEAPLYYNVYRSNVGGAAGSSVLIQEKVIDTSFTDPNLPAILAEGPADLDATAVEIPNAALSTGTWTYRVSALTDRGESLPSTAVNATVTLPQNSVTLSWPQVPDAVSYRVYRSDTPGSLTLHRIAEGIRATGFSDQGAAAGTVLPADGRQLPPPGLRQTLPPGTLGAWQPARSELNVPRYALAMTTHETEVDGQSVTEVFAIGGRNGSTDLDVIEQTFVDSTGALGCWKLAPETLSVPRSFPVVEWADSESVPAFAGTETAFLQVAYGRSQDPNDFILPSVEWSLLMNGQLDAFQGPRDAQRDLWGTGVAVVNGFLYSVGGSPGLTNPFRVQIDENAVSGVDGGILGGSSAASTMDGPHGFAPLIRAPSHLYILGGNTNKPHEPALTDVVETIPF